MTAVLDVYLEVNSVPLDTYGWRCLDYSDLMDGPTLRGSDRLFPRAEGRRAKRRRIDARVVSLSMMVFGTQDQDNTPYSDPLLGLYANRDYLRANLGLAESTGDGTVNAVFYRDSLADLTGDVTVLAMADWQTVRGIEATFRLDLSIPAGELTP